MSVKNLTTLTSLKSNCFLQFGSRGGNTDNDP